MNVKPGKMIPMAARLLCAAVLACSMVSQARAGSTFTSTYLVGSVICDIAQIKGDFSGDRSVYVSNGTCVNLSVSNDEGRGESKFPGTNDSKVVFQAGWTATGGYNPVTKETWETVTMPAPRTDEHTPPGRPYGVFASKMICAADPWTDPATPACTGITVSASGNLGEAETMFRSLKRPLTRPFRQPQWQALHDAHELFAQRRATLFTQSVPASKTAHKLMAWAEIVEPQAGSTHPPQTPLKIRVAAPMYVKVQTYMLHLERQQPDGSWRVTTNLPVSAAEVEGAPGYQGWGGSPPGSSAQMVAGLGRYRVRAQAMTPQGEAGDWHEFIIAGEPAAQPSKYVSRPAAAAAVGPGPATTLGTMGTARKVLTKPVVMPPPSAFAPLQSATSALPAQQPERAGALDWSRAATGAMAVQRP